ncbi:unnamed protein product [Parnassius mnemosyne]|uniref:Uncharacterized protein n=1 Tax=Parnassius mnemosyne TaxID=213953 RepID=A0AAV1M5B7_9NEOP
MPDAVNAIMKNQSMNDFIDSLPDVATATKMIKDISYIKQQGGFVMRNWLSNNPIVLNDMPKETLNDMAIRFNVESQAERTLGLLWFPASDMFGFDLSLKRIPSDILQLSRKPTKREVLRIIMSVYDIHGFLAPFTIKSKMLMREIWNVGIKWDQEITDSLFVLFKDWISQLQEMSYVRIPRWYFYSDDSVGVNEKNGRTVNDNETSLQLHIFCDASPCAYACVAYWRKQDSNCVQVSFIASNSRVAPLKPLTMPKLELQGALLACRLADYKKGA